MKTNQTNSFKADWRIMCDDYAKAFAEKHEYDIDTDIEMHALWVGDDPGTIACICDMFISMDDIRYDIDNNIPAEYFEKWYWKSLDRHECNLKYMNYESFCKGCPDPLTPEQEEEIKKLQRNVAEAKQILQDAINKHNAGTKPVF